MTTHTTLAPTQGSDGFARPKNEEAPSGRDTGQGHSSKATVPRHDTAPVHIDSTPDRWRVLADLQAAIEAAGLGSPEVIPDGRLAPTSV